MADEKRVVEIVVKAVGDADLKRLASELQGMRKESQSARKEMEQSNKTLAHMRREAQLTRREISQTNQTLGGFGSTFGKLSKAFGAGFAITKLVQSSDVVRDLAHNVQELTGEFIDATLEASGFTDLLDDEFWMTAQQGARDLARAIGGIFGSMKQAGEDPAIAKAASLLIPGGLTARAQWGKYKKDVTFDMMPISGDAFTEQMGDLGRELGKQREDLLKASTDDVLKKLGIVLRNQRLETDRQRIDSREHADLEQYLEQVSKANRGRLEGSGLEDRLRILSEGIDATFKPMTIDIEQVGDDMLQMTEQSARFQENWQRIATTTLDWGEALENAIDYMQQLNELQGDLTNQAIAWSESLTYAFKGVLTGELHNTRDVLRAITDEMRNFYAELAARAASEQIAGWLKLALGAFAGVGTGRIADTPSVDASVRLAAKGDAFAGGRVVPMANGGIVTGPTLFPMARGMGLMGEAGPEAVLPLRRGRDGRLGVSSGGSKVVIENHGAPVSASVDDSEGEMRIVLRAARLGASMAVGEMNQSIRSGYGSTAQSLGRTYGLRRR